MLGPEQSPLDNWQSPVVNIETLRADVLRLTIQERLSQIMMESIPNASLRMHMDSLVEDMVVSLERRIAGLPEKMIRVYERIPVNWWEAVRERWMPRWWLRKYPVQYRIIHINEQIYKAVCPHVYLDPEKRHIQWMIQQDRALPES